MFKILKNRTRKSRFLQITTFLYSGRWKKKKKKKKKKNELHLLACSAALGPKGREQPSIFFFLCCGALASALISHGNLLKNRGSGNPLPDIVET